MIIEVGNTYQANDGKFWRIIQEDILQRHQDATEFKFVGANDGCKYVRFNANGDSCLDIKLISESNDAQELWGGCVGAWSGNFTKIPDTLVWEWKTPDKEGIWALRRDAYGGTLTEQAPKAMSVQLIENVKSCFYLKCWRCYLGPVPEISQPKKPVKQTLWMVKCFNRLLWEELWLPDEETPKLWCLHDIAHKTCTTRTV
jgi:hypothetical protein